MGEVDQPKRLAWGEFRALCKRFPGGDHEPAIATLIAGGDAVRRKLTASPPTSLVGQGSSPTAGVRRALPWRLKSPGGKAQAVCARVTLNPLFPAVVSRQQLIERDRQIADADARCMIDGVGDGRSGADDADLANALHAYGVDVGSSSSIQVTSISPTSALVAMWYSAKSWLT